MGEYEDGGFNMTDIIHQNKAIKASWMKRLINNSGMWRECVMEQIPIVDFLRYNLKKTDHQ